LADLSVRAAPVDFTVLMPRPAKLRAIFTLAIAISVAAVCVRLGLWQASRLAARQAHNAMLIARLGDPAVSVNALSADTAAGHYRRVTAHGAPQYDRDIAWAPRMRQGSPGVNLLTPLTRSGTDTVVLLNRGWAYSADAKSVEFARWRERDTLSVAGYVETWAQDCAVTERVPLPVLCGDSATRLLRRLDRRAAERLVGKPVAAYLIMQTSDSALRADSVPARVEEPVLDEGPHRGYAFQWFGFALIALVGGSALALSQRSR
jgi:surfeit locus 1 family protein